jgi:uncharacterized membrane protein
MSDPRVRRTETESRWPAAIAIVVALALYTTLPGTFFPELRYVVLALGVVLLIPLIVLNPRRLNREARWSRLLSIGQTLILLIANQVALIQLIVQLVTVQGSDGHPLLLAALQVWVTNIIAYALLYWELDRGGPVARRIRAREKLEPADFRFPQDEDHDAVTEVAVRSSVKSDWVPGYVDYLYFSLSNAMAFSPTDTMPLSHRAKALMGFEAFAGFVLLALVISRAVSLLG